MDSELRTAQRRAGRVDPILEVPYFDGDGAHAFHAFDLRVYCEFWGPKHPGDAAVLIPDNLARDRLVIPAPRLDELGGVEALYQRWRAARGA